MEFVLKGLGEYADASITCDNIVVLRMKAGVVLGSAGRMHLGTPETRYSDTFTLRLHEGVLPG